MNLRALELLSADLDDGFDALTTAIDKLKEQLADTNNEVRLLRQRVDDLEHQQAADRRDVQNVERTLGNHTHELSQGERTGSP